MADRYYSPGPNAERAFKLGLATALTIAGLLLAGMFYGRVIDWRELVVVAVIGLPVVYILTACLLSVWLGFDKRL